MAPSLVSTEWLAAHLRDPDVTIVDGSFYLAALKRDANTEYLAAHIPGAVRFDIAAIADRTTSLPHMLPMVWAAPGHDWRSTGNDRRGPADMGTLPFVASGDSHRPGFWLYIADRCHLWPGLTDAPAAAISRRAHPAPAFPPAPRARVRALDGRPWPDEERRVDREGGRSDVFLEEVINWTKKTKPKLPN